MRFTWMFIIGMFLFQACSCRAPVGEDCPTVKPPDCSAFENMPRRFNIESDTGQPQSVTLPRPISEKKVRYSLYEDSTSSDTHYTSALLPKGIKLDPETGTLEGTTQAVGIFHFFVTIEDEEQTCAQLLGVSWILKKPGLQYFPFARPIHFLDSSDGASACVGEVGPPFEGKQLSLQVAGRTCAGQSIPSEAEAVWVVVSSKRGQRLSMPHPSGERLSKGIEFSVNGSNSMAVELKNQALTFPVGASDYQVDILGYFAPPAPGGLYFHPLPEPILWVDTERPGSACQAVSGAVSKTTPTLVPATGSCRSLSVPANATAIFGRLTVPSGSGNAIQTLLVSSSENDWSTIDEKEQPLTAAFSLSIGADTAYVTQISNGFIQVTTKEDTHVAMDIRGYFSEDAEDVNWKGLLFRPLSVPYTHFSARGKTEGCFSPNDLPENANVPAGNTYSIPFYASCFDSVIPRTAAAVMLNLSTYKYPPGALTLWPEGENMPSLPGKVFNLFTERIPSMSITRLAPNGKLSVHNEKEGDYAIDVHGYFAP